MGISIWQLLIILAIVLLLFGAKRLKNLGPDLGSAIKGFRSSIKEGEEALKKQDDDNVIEGEVTKKENDKV